MLIASAPPSALLILFKILTDMHDMATLSTPDGQVPLSDGLACVLQSLTELFFDYMNNSYFILQISSIFVWSWFYFSILFIEL